MRKILLTAAIVVLTISSALAQTITRNYKLSGFTAIDASYTYDVYITKGNSDKIKVVCPEDVAEYLIIDVRMGTLYLKVDLPRNFHKNNKRKDDEVKIYLQMKEISSIHLSGASSLSATGNFNTDVFKCSLSGASSINNTLNISGKKLVYDLSGAANAKIAGDFDQMSGHASGATSFSITGNISETKISASGAAKFTYSGDAATYINVDAAGASDVILRGKTPVITIDCAGAANVIGEQMHTQKATASASGASSIKVHADDTLILSTAGASSIRYYGNAKNITKFMQHKAGKIIFRD